MKNKIFLSITCFAAATLAMAACTESGHDSPNGEGVRLGSINLEVAGLATRVYQADPTMSSVGVRAAAGHALSVEVAGNSTSYKYMNGEWVPADDAAEFPGYGRSEITLTLAKTPETVQDGSAEGLLDADRLTYTAVVSPARELRGIEMTHARTLIQVQFEGELTVDQGTDLRIDGSVAYNVPFSKSHQAIVEPGIDGFNVILTRDGVDYAIYIPKSQVSDGQFRANYRYTLLLTSVGKAISLKAIVLEPWSEAGVGTAVPLMKGNVEFTGGYTAGTPVRVLYASGIENDLDFDDPANPSIGSAWGKGGDIVRSIRVGSHPEILIGRAVGETVTLALSDGGAAVSLRTDGSSRYLIGTIAEFRSIETLPSASFLQQADIYMMGLLWRPLFDYDATPTNPFTGTFDGGGKKIHDIFYNAGRGALFLGNRGVIKNVHVASGLVGANGYINTAGICVYNMTGGTIENCTNEARIEASSWLAGICTINEGTISGCVNRGDIKAYGDAGFSNAGGIAGSNGIESSAATVENCTNYGTLECSNNNVGGITSTTMAGTVSGCVNEGAINGNAYVGGITSDASSLIVNCTNRGVVRAASSCGGIVGIPYAGTKISRCTNEGSVTTTAIGLVGGIASATMYQAEIVDCRNSGAVTGTSAAGGIVAYHTTGTIAACVNTGVIRSSGERVGGIVGDNTHLITACYNRSTGISSSSNVVGGIAGYNWAGGTIEACYSVGSVTAGAGRETFGGIAGENRGAFTELDGERPASRIVNCYWSGVTKGVGVNSADPEYVTAALFGADEWPTDDAAKKWGVGGDYASGLYWASLGAYSASAPVYPKLHWEN